jgi:imidazolonepropionase-like amidohydrolase
MKLALVVCLTLTIATVTGAGAQGIVAIRGATVIAAGAAPMPDAVIVIEGPKISRVGPRATTVIPANATIVDASGKYVVPGLADMHNHLGDGGMSQQQNVRANLSTLLAFGVTTVFDPSSSVSEFADAKSATSADTAPFPRFYGTGPIVTVKGDFLGASVGSPTPGTEAEAREVVKMLKAAGVDAIKVNRDDLSWASTRRLPLMPMDVLSALVDEAHRQGLKVFAHAPMLAQAKDVLRAGGDGLLHGILDQPVDEELIGLLRRNRAVYVPTLSVFEDVADVAGWARRQSMYDDRGIVAPIADPFTSAAGVRMFESFFDNTPFTKSHLATARANVKAIADADIPVVMGTDSGFYGVFAGVSSQLELALMVEAGLTPAAALRAATVNAARMLGRDAQVGSIESGKMADLLVLDANPLDDIRNLRRIHRVVKGGAVYDPAQLLGGVKSSAPPSSSNR